MIKLISGMDNGSRKFHLNMYSMEDRIIICKWIIIQVFKFIKQVDIDILLFNTDKKANF